jgi:hypothetical protein
VTTDTDESAPSLLPAGLRPQPGPVDERWALGVGDLLARVAPGPDVLRDVLRLLNRFGGLAVSGESVEFDGDSVKWADVDAVETHKLLGYLLSGALDKQVDRLPLPWFPFRGLALDVASQAVLTLFVAAAGGVLGKSLDVQIPAEVNYRGLMRHRSLSPGVLGTLLMADPAVKESILATARAHGVVIQPADDDAMTTAQRRAKQLTSLLSGLRSRSRAERG